MVVVFLPIELRVRERASVGGRPGHRNKVELQHAGDPVRQTHLKEAFR